MRLANWLSLTIVLTGSALYGQVGAPVLGFVPDGTRIRPVWGMPAAAFIAPQLPTSRELARIIASPARDYILGSAADNGDVVLVSPDGSLSMLKGTRSSPDEIAISPEGTSAALWFGSIGHAQILTGLPHAPQVREVDASFLGANPYALSVSDDGQWLAGAWRAGNYAFGPHGEVNRLPVEEIVSAVGFLHGRHDVTLGTHEQVVLVGDVGGANRASVLVTGLGRLDPVAVGVSSGNQRLVIANPRGKVTSVDLGSGATQTAECSCVPEGLFPLGSGAFRLTGLRSGAFQIYDPDTGQVLAAPLINSNGDSNVAQAGGQR